MKREHGFYWVKRSIIWHGPPRKEEIVWEIAKYHYGRWLLADASIAEYRDESFLEIDERRINRLE